MRRRGFGFIILPVALVLGALQVQPQVSSGSQRPVAELPYRLASDFLKLPSNLYFSEVSGVALNSKGHIFVFQRGSHPLVEFDESGNFVRAMGEGLLTRPHGLRIDTADNIWVTDNGAHFVLKLSPEGRIIMVLGQKDYPGTDHSHFDGPDDVAFGKSGEIYVADGEGNSRVVEFDREGHYLREWGRKGSFYCWPWSLGSLTRSRNPPIPHHFSRVPARVYRDVLPCDLSGRIGQFEMVAIEDVSLLNRRCSVYSRELPVSESPKSDLLEFARVARASWVWCT